MEVSKSSFLPSVASASTLQRAFSSENYRPPGDEHSTCHPLSGIKGQDPGLTNGITLSLTFQQPTGTNLRRSEVPTASSDSTAPKDPTNKPELSSAEFYRTQRVPKTVMTESIAAAPKPSSSVKLVLLGEAAVGKVSRLQMQPCNTTQGHGPEADTYRHTNLYSHLSCFVSSTMIFKKTRSQP